MPRSARRSCLAPTQALGGPIDILVNNAAAAIYQPLIDFPLKRRRLIFEVNVHAPMDLAQAVVPSMVERGEGWIVNISSATAHLSEPPFQRGRWVRRPGCTAHRKPHSIGSPTHWALSSRRRGVRVNTIEPRSAVMSEGAEVLIGGPLRQDQVESMEEMVEAILALCDCPSERTGRTHVSLDLLAELALPVHRLDGSPLSDSPHLSSDTSR